MKCVGAQQAALRTLIEQAKHELLTWQKLVAFVRRRGECEGRRSRELAACWSKGDEDAIDAITGFFSGLVDDVLEVSDGATADGERQGGRQDGARLRSISTGHFGTLRDALSSMDVGITAQVEGSRRAASALSALAAEAAEGLSEHESRLHETFGRAVQKLRELSEALQGLSACRSAFHRWAASRATLEEQMVASASAELVADAELETLSEKLAEAAERTAKEESKYREVLERTNGRLESFYESDMPELLQTYRSLRAERMDALRTLLSGYGAALGEAAERDREGCVVLQAAAVHIDADLDYRSTLLDTAAPLLAPEKKLEFVQFSERAREKYRDRDKVETDVGDKSEKGGERQRDGAVEADEEARIAAGETTAEEINTASKAAAARRARRQRQVERKEQDPATETVRDIDSGRDSEEQRKLEQRRRSLFGQRAAVAVGDSSSDSDVDDGEQSTNSDDSSSEERAESSERDTEKEQRLGAGVRRADVSVDVFVCVCRSVFRSGAERDSPQVGVIEIGEHVEVLEQCYVPYPLSSSQKRSERLRAAAAANMKQQLRVRGVRGWASVESAKGQLILTPVDPAGLLWYKEQQQQKKKKETAQDTEQPPMVSDTGIFRRLCAAAIRVDATAASSSNSSSNSNSSSSGIRSIHSADRHRRAAATPWLLDVNLAGDSALRAKAHSLLQLLATGGLSGKDALSAAKLAQEYGTAVYAALSLWVRARRWPLIPIRFYARATSMDSEVSSEPAHEPERVKRLLRQLPRHSAEAVESVAREAVQLLYVAPRIAGRTTQEFASLLAPAFLWGGALERRSMSDRLPAAEVLFTNAVLNAQLQDLMAAFPDPSVAMAQILGAPTGSAPPTPRKQQPPQPQMQRPRPGSQPAASGSFELDLAEFEKELDAAAADRWKIQPRQQTSTATTAQPAAAEQQGQERTRVAKAKVDSLFDEVEQRSTMSSPSESQYTAQSSSIHVLNERVELLEAMAEEAKRSAAEANRSLAATKRAAATQITEAQAQAQTQVAALEEQIKSLVQLNEQLEHGKAIFIDAHAVLKSRLGATEEEKRRVQEELKGAQEGSEALCAEIDRLRASVEELVTQSASSSGGGVAQATVGSGLRRASSAFLGERAHLSMRPTSSDGSSNGGSSVDAAAANAAVAMGEEPKGAGGTTREHRRSIVAVSLRLGF